MNLEPPSQVFATTLYDQYQAQSLSFLFIPKRSLKNQQIPSLDQIAFAFALAPMAVQTIPEPQLPLALASLLSATEHARGPFIQDFAWLDQINRAGRERISVDPNALGFAEYVAFSPVIPFEESPLKGKSLLDIVRDAAKVVVPAGAVGAGLKMGLVSAALHPPLVVITVPTGIVLCTAAAVIGPNVGGYLSEFFRRLVNTGEATP